MTDDRKRPATDRILKTAMEVISDFGVRRFTIDELSRRVGLSRVTIYRHFENKSEVLEATMLQELGRFMAHIDAVVAPLDPEQRMVEAFVMMVTTLRGHAVLQRLLRTEPELILPLLTTEGGPMLVVGREFLARVARGQPEAAGLTDPVRVEVLAELLARMVMSFVLTSDSLLSLDSEAALRASATEYVGALVRDVVTVPAALPFARSDH